MKANRVLIKNQFARTFCADRQRIALHSFELHLPEAAL